MGEKCGKNKKIDLFREDAGALDQHVACAVAAKIASYLHFYLVHQTLARMKINHFYCKFNSCSERFQSHKIAELTCFYRKYIQ